MMMKNLSLVLLAVFLCRTAALAQDPPMAAKAPIEITADKTLEWHRKSNQYIANGNVSVKQGDITIRADTITADYRDGQGSGFTIDRLTATGHVAIDSKSGTASGDKLIYTVETGLAVMTGNDLKMSSPEQTITATERFEYSAHDGKLTAIGKATVLRGKDRLQADSIAATMKDDSTGNRTLERLDARGHVAITTPTETLTGESGFYIASSNTAEISGSVKIIRARNELSGSKARVDLTTGISTMFGSPADGGRVRGTFYPGGQ